MMNQPDPSREEARAALAEATAHQSRVRQTDKQFRLILVGLAVTYLVFGLLVGFVRGRPSAIAGILILLAISVGAIGMMLRMRAYSRAGPRNFALAAAAFTWWNAAVVGVSSASGWWGPLQPRTHFTVSAAVAALPLLVAAWLIGRVR